MPALPFILLTNDLNVLTSSALEQAQLPPHMQFTKLFSAADVETLKLEFQKAKDMGPGTVEEWVKGLPGRGKVVRHEALKWEKWASSGGIEKMRTLLYPGYVPKHSSPSSPDQTVPTNLPEDVGSNNVSSGGKYQSQLQPRRERTVEEVQELKAARKTEIERRALLLDPPLTTEVLQHIPSFEAAMQLITPLDDNAWERLKPRLLAQRADAEQRVREKQIGSQARPGPADRPNLEMTLATTKEARDLVDKEWEEKQAPLRARIAFFADETIRDKWEKAKKLTKDSCSKFAVDVLLFVRRRFYAEIAENAASLRAAGQEPPIDPPEGPFTQKLTLENMKWIFDTKIKPHTEHHRKELFYCNGCEGNYKTFGFEGVIQHYAAKHTSALSVGSIVVHWRAEWPEHPPFSPEAKPVKQPLYKQNPRHPFSNAGPSPNRYSYPPMPVHVVPPFPPPFPPQPSPGYNTGPYSDPYHHQPLPAPPAPPPPPTAFQPPTTYPFAPQTSYVQQAHHLVPPAYPLFQPQPSGVPYAPPGSVDAGQPYASPQGGEYGYNYGHYQATTGQPVGPAPPPPTYRDSYQTKLEDMARNAREIWHSLSNIRDLPGSVRVYTTIHHLVKRYRLRFNETPSLSMFIDGLSNNKDMRPVRNINGLVCKVCRLRRGNPASLDQERKSFSLPQLANHFQSKHVEPMQQSPMDWVVDMVFLPHLSSLSNLNSSVNESQKRLLSDAIPEAFRTQASSDFQKFSHAESFLKPPAHVPEELYMPALPNPAREEQVVDDLKRDNQYRRAYDPSNGHQAAPHVRGADNARLVHETDGRPLSRNSRPGRDQNSNQKKRNGKVKRGTMQSFSEAGGRSAKEDTGFVKEESRFEEKTGAAWNTSRHETAHPYTSSTSMNAEGERSGQHAAPETQSHTPNSFQRPQSRVASRLLLREEATVAAGFERHPDQRRLLADVDGQHATDEYGMDRMVDGKGLVLHKEMRPVSQTYTAYGSEYDQPRSPYGARYYQPSLGTRHDGATQEVEAVHDPRSVDTEAHDARYVRSRVTEAGEPYPLFSGERGYDRAPIRGEGAGYDPIPRVEYYRQPLEVQARPRPPVEAYEIVQITDSNGEQYVVRRPIRRGPDMGYVYLEDQRTFVKGHPYAEDELIYAPVSRVGPSEERSIFRDRPQMDGRAESRAEYDPRFPAA